jgi:cobalt/nickel transport system permease protein
VHIPDGYLSPQTCAAGFAVAIPVWATAARRVNAVVKTRNVAMLAVFSALSFLVMMFNIPIPDGTTAHAVGGAVIAICLGPWAAVIAVSVALAFQALLFGDGGVLAYGVNCVNMAVILPFVAIAIYRLGSGRAPLSSRRRVVAAAVGGYAGINAAAFAAAVELGIQPGLFHTAGGAPLYSPYHLSQTIPAMALAHLTVAGFAEAALTGAVLAYLQRADVTRLVANHPGIAVTTADVVPRPPRLSPARVAVAVMALITLLTPLGLLAPGGAFGEDAPGELDLNSLGLRSVPTGLDRYNGFWSHALLGGYGFRSGDHADLGYIASALIGVIVIGVGVFAVCKLVVVLRREPVADLPSDPTERSSSHV